MKVAPVVKNEQEKLKTLNEYFIHDSLPADLEDITRLASAICNTPLSIICFTQANAPAFRSKYGISLPANPAFCLYALNPGDEALVVPDLTADKRFCNDALVTGKPNLVFYAAVPVTDNEGKTLGSLCIIDNKPGNLNTAQIKSLLALARQVVALLELRAATIKLNRKEAELSGAVNDQDKITRIASHDLKSPLNNIISLTHLLKDEHGEKLDEEGNEYIAFLNEAAYHLSDLITGIVKYGKSSQLPVNNRENILVNDLVAEVTGLLNAPAHVTIKYKKNNGSIYASRIPVRQVLLQLLRNSIQHNDNNRIKAEVLFRDSADAYTFEVRDNGQGIADEDKEKVFNLFERLQKTKDGESLGIGLSIAKRLVEKMGGEIKIDTTTDKGSSFIFSIPK